MTVFQTEVVMRNGSDAEFRAWVSAISNGLTACGLVQTADTGQINRATVAAPSTNAQIRGYEIFRFNDALQATKPIFIKVEYGSASGSTTFVFMAWTVGTGTDGAGNITGIVSSRQTLFYALSGNVPSPVLVSGGDGGLAMALTSATSGNAFIWQCHFFVERSRGADGVVNGDGFWVGWASVANGSAACQFFSFTNNTQSTLQGNWPVPFPSRFSSANAGTSMTLFPAVVVTPKAQGPSLLLLACGLNDYVRGTLVSVFIAGAVHTYYAITGTNQGRSVEGSACGFLMRWE